MALAALLFATVSCWLLGRLCLCVLVAPIAIHGTSLPTPLSTRFGASCNVFCRPGTSSRHAFYLVVVILVGHLPSLSLSWPAHAQDVAR